jgi:antitoxin VapB
VATAKVFKSGNSQALRLPKEFRLKGSEVEIFRRGDEIVVRDKPRTMADAFELLAQIDLFERQDAPPQRRKGFP